MSKFAEDAVALRHALPSRLFHWCLVLGFIPAAITGVILFLRPLGPEGMHLAMQIHIVGAWILMIGSTLFFLLASDRVAAFWRDAFFSWKNDDIIWLAKGGGYPQKMLLNKEIDVPPMGKMNSGQKMMGILVFFGTLIIIASGAILYFALPLVPKAIAYYADKAHLIVGLFLTLCVFCGHIPLGIYNWAAFKSMFGDGTIRVKEAEHHNKLWVEEELKKIS
ncbi:formate dehydrogenase subunit gamma [Selenomonas ruminantium]|uniref:Formate dehydrogenase subunit gamma n=1 Tax=Selenomonas ruminantium TaxID=971 RepID=A0A1M6TZC7_SELRU|nr:cytochrome b/b6 domain-containing protein [Selenomonas ruminantium]SHK62365.1 formate dehydrogenase subunit gamma [Selenomonas ruminantium]